MNTRANQYAYEQEILAWRDDRLQRLQKPDSWLSLVGMRWLRTGTTRIGSAADNGTKLNVGPAHIGLLTLRSLCSGLIPHDTSIGGLFT